MKKILPFAAAIFFFCACTADIDWEYNGYAEIKNETSQTVIIAIAEDQDSQFLGGIHHMPFRPTDGVVNAGKALTQFYWDPDQESIKSGIVPTIVTITLADGSQVVCAPDSEAGWSRRFYDNSEIRRSAVWSHFQKHEIIIETYHIDDEFVRLWRDSGLK